MKSTRRIFATTAEADAYVPLDGETFIDAEKNSLRVGLGGVPGGYEVVGTRAYIPDYPGPDTLVGGDETDGFYGEFAATEFITGDALAAAIGLSAGSSYFSDAPWLKFSLDGRTLYTPKQPHRNVLGALDVAAVGALDGTATVVIGDFTYKVMGWKVVANPPSPNTMGADLPEHAGSEWARLMHRICVDVPATQSGANWVEYTKADLNIGDIYEITGDPCDSTTYPYAIINNLNYLNRTTGGGTSQRWRPVLEPV